MENKSYGFLVSQPSATNIEEITILIEPSIFIGDYSRALVKEIQRINPIMFDAHPITENELSDYFKYLISERVKSISESANWKNDKLLWIPDWIQYVISLIGEFFNYQYGLKFVPKIDDDIKIIDFKTAFTTSEKLAMYAHDIGMQRDAMPRGSEGDEDVMSCALIANQVRATRRLTHPESSYVAAFAGLKLQEEAAMSVLYRIHYDDLDYIRADLSTNSKVITG